MIANTIDRQSIQESFREWQSEADTLDAQFAESLAALEAYQSHLDKWQSELAHEREELRAAQEELARSASREADPDEDDGEGAKQLDLAQQQILALREEVHRLERSRDELTTELEQIRKECNSGRDEPVRTGSGQGTSPSVANPGRTRTASPVLGSIVEQFGKLRQQRAQERHSGKPPARVKE